MIKKILIIKLSLCLLNQSAFAMNKRSSIWQFNRLAPFNAKQITNNLFHPRLLSRLYSTKRSSRPLVILASQEKDNNDYSSRNFLLPIILGTSIGAYLKEEYYADQPNKHSNGSSKSCSDHKENCSLGSKIKQFFFTQHKNYPKQYSINLMWINRQATIDQTYIYPSNNKNNFGLQFLDTIIMWSKKNPEGTINLWFDSSFTADKMIENTQLLINQKVAAHGSKIAKIELNDIRTLTRVKKNPEIFSSEIPVFFRADLLRVIIAEESTRQNRDLCFVYTDFDAKPMTKSQLFDNKTLENLDNYGFVVADYPNKLKFENSFQIFTYNKQLFKAIKLMIIKANILRACSFLEDIKEKSDSKSILNNAHVWKIHEIGFQENVFYSYPLMFAYFCQLQNSSALTLSNSDKPYDKKSDGKEVLNINAKILMATSSSVNNLSKFPIPTKKVSLPPSTSAQNELSKAK